MTDVVSLRRVQADNGVRAAKPKNEPRETAMIKTEYMTLKTGLVMVEVPPQRWWRVETHRHGKGRWHPIGPVHGSKIQAEAWARHRGLLTREEAENGSREGVFRIVEEES